MCFLCFSFLKIGSDDHRFEFLLFASHSRGVVSIVIASGLETIEMAAVATATTVEADEVLLQIYELQV